MSSFNFLPSSSSSVPAKRWTYDVFLSFRGEDTRNNFVDHLYAALVQKGLFTFKDDELLHKGKLISPELLKAIEESRFAVVVFSENYVNSSWCLDELTKIMECRNLTGQKVLPVFYHINPSDIRGRKRTYALAFQKHEETFRREQEKLNKWRETLVEASNLSGWHISESFNRGENEFINKIVQEILENIQPHGMDHNLIGIEPHMQALNSILCTELTEEVRVVGICGMGGIGKTTIARTMFRRIAHKFEGSSFVNDVRENSSSRRDICVLQEKVLKDLLSMFSRFLIQDPDHGAYLIRTKLSSKKVLLVLDDVDNNKQLEFLAARHDWFGKGSRIIITTRDEHLLADAHFKYQPNCLLMDQAFELFSLHAFHKHNPPEGYEELSRRAIQYTGYLPLALKVLGSFFRGRETGVWESAFNKLAKTPNPEIYETLKLSYDSLDVSGKKIFLDIACFFKGKDKEEVTRILDSFGFDPVIGITILIEKSLITISNKKLGMHDLIQEMGWQIVCENFPKSRLCELDEIQDLINRNGKLKSIEAIVLTNKKCNSDKNINFSAEVFKKMKNLRLLDVESTFTYSEPSFLPESLRWLCWNRYPFSSLPVEHMGKLVGLELFRGYIVNLWDKRQILPNLKFVDLRNSLNLTRFPDVSGAPNIERLILSDCGSLAEVHQSLGFLRGLVYLDMSFCSELRRLPSMIEMESLETLILTGCWKLERFPELSPCMVKLSNINLDNCIQLEKLPSSIRYLSGLSCLSLISCQNLKNIPRSIWELKRLKSLYLHNCMKLQKLPEELGSMENLRELLLGFPEDRDYATLPDSVGFHSLCSLRKLDLSWRQIEEQNFPQNLCSLSSLEELHLSGNSKLTHLPIFISHLSRLKLLELNKCRRLRTLNALPSGLQVLKARGCRSLEKIGDLAEEFEWLYKIWLLDCHKLLKGQLNKRYLDNMLQKSFLQKCAAVNHRASIAIPGSNMPSWLKEQRHGCNITLNLPPKFYTQILGFVICGLFDVNWEPQYASPQIMFRIVLDKEMVPVSEFDSTNALADRGNVLMSYIPFGFFQQMYHDIQPQDWSHIEGNLSISITRRDGSKSVKCGAHIVYREDVESTENKYTTCISDYGNLVQVDGDTYDEEDDPDYDRRLSGNTYVYEEKLDDQNSKLMPLRSRMSYRNIIDLTIVAVTLSGTR